MIVKVEDDVYIFIMPDVSIVFTDSIGFDMFVRRKGKWFINTGGNPNTWSNALLNEYQIILENHFLSERRESIINELTSNNIGEPFYI